MGRDTTAQYLTDSQQAVPIDVSFGRYITASCCVLQADARRRLENNSINSLSGNCPPKSWLRYFIDRVTGDSEDRLINKASFVRASGMMIIRRTIRWGTVSCRWSHTNFWRVDSGPWKLQVSFVC
nr:unnamed protein product [Spirometra erinaceieuropaei]